MLISYFSAYLYVAEMVFHSSMYVIVLLHEKIISLIFQWICWYGSQNQSEWLIHSQVQLKRPAVYVWNDMRVSKWQNVMRKLVMLNM